MKYIKIALFLFFANICIGSFLKHLNSDKNIINIFYFIILGYICAIGVAGMMLLFQIILLTFQFQNKEKEIRSKINELKLKNKMNVKLFYKSILKILDLTLFQKEIVKALLKLGLSIKIIN